MKPEDIIIAPIITEKSNDGLNEGKYTFEVNPKATKIDINTRLEKSYCYNRYKPRTKNIFRKRWKNNKDF